MTDKQKPKLIEPRTLRGFNDLLPDDAMVLSALLRRIEDTFSSYGFSQIVTPALEYEEILKGKGGEESDKGMFGFEDQGGRRVAMRFDLTVPLARFVAQHEGKLRFPFRASQIGWVWRGDRPQRGRYRELIQCDADVIGVTGPVVDAEIIQLVHATLSRLEIGKFLIRLNDRRLLDALFEGVGISGDSIPILRSIDKLEKIGVAGVERELGELGLAADVTSRLLDFVAAGEGIGSGATLEDVAPLVAPHGAGAEALDGLGEVLELVQAAGTPAGGVIFDPSIARGLDYYTGIVYETTLLAAPDVGSISSGGRYDNLAGLFTKTHLPGVGGTIGISRIMGAIGAGQLRLGELKPLVLVLTPGERALRRVAVATAEQIRSALPVRCEVYPGEHAHKRQMKYANARSAQFALTIDAPDRIVVKDMVGAGVEVCTPETVVRFLARRLDPGGG